MGEPCNLLVQFGPVRLKSCQLLAKLLLSLKCRFGLMEFSLQAANFTALGLQLCNPLLQRRCLLLVRLERFDFSLQLSGANSLFASLLQLPFHHGDGLARFLSLR